VAALQGAGHEVVGLDTCLFEECAFGPPLPSVEELRCDVREVRREQLAGFDAVVHLAAISNDPLGELDPDTTYDINHRATVRLAELARSAGVERFLFSSSCSMYGKVGDAVLDETAAFNPLTAYAASKVLAERDLASLANESFAPVFLRNATAYGVSPYLRMDLVVNNLAGAAFATGQALVKSDGTPWRPLVHVEDIAQAFLAALEAPLDLVRGEAFNVGGTDHNYTVATIASVVQEVIPGSVVVYAPGGGPDARSYRVDCSKVARTLGFKPRWDLRRGVEQLYRAFQVHGLSPEDVEGPRYVRIERIKELQQRGLLDHELRWR
jgi:nucleoside-diphosphate-sugar epimerase